jgi:serine/threonine protein kinase
MLQAEQVLQGRYQLKQQLGNNAGRQTWLAEDLAVEPSSDSAPVPALVIVKLLPFSPQLHWDDLKLFEREAQVLKHLNHPCIPKYRDYFSTEPSNSGELPWFGLVQDYIPGDSLQQLLKKGKRFTEAEAKQIAIQLLKILIYLHELSPPVLHRDIKPSNIIWGKYGQVYLVDFGAVQDRAKAEGVTFTVVGTGGYAPPEQLWGRAVPASDLYALGATLIHLLTGTAPADLPQRQMRLQFQGQVSLTPSFAHWIETLTDPAPELRFSNARGALEALQASSSPSTPLETANTGSQETTPKERDRAITIAVLQYVFVFLFAIAVPSMFAMVWKARQAEGKQNVGAMNRAEQAYFLEKSEFTDSITDLGLGIKTQTENYNYSIRAMPLSAFNYAVSRKYDLKSYVGGVFLTSADEATDEILTQGLVCETNSRGTKRPSEPIIRGNVVECAPNTKPLGKTAPLVLGKDSALAYNALNYAATGQYDQAVLLTKSIDSNFLKDKALKVIANQSPLPSQRLQTTGSLSQVLEFVETIKDIEIKASILSNIAREATAANRRVQVTENLSQALEVAKTIKDAEIKAWVLAGIAHKYERAGQQSQSTGIFSQAIEVAKTIQDTETKAMVLADIARDLALAGQQSQATRIFSQAIEVVKTIQDTETKAMVLADIARDLAQAGQYDQALQVAETIKNDYAKQGALEAIARYRKSP